MADVWATVMESVTCERVVASTGKGEGVDPWMIKQSVSSRAVC